MSTVVRITLEITLDTDDDETLQPANLTEIAQVADKIFLDADVLGVFSEDIGFVITAAEVGAVTEA